MKQSQRLLLLVILLSLTASQVGCTNRDPKKAIRKAAYGYLDAMANYRVDDAMLYCTRETQESVIVKARELMATVQEGYIESDTPAKVTIKKIEMTSDTTAIVHFHKKTPLKKQDGELQMVLRRGSWRAHVVLPKRKPISTDEFANPNNAAEPDTIIEINGRVAIPLPQKKMDR